ncbi:hypothetical protein B586_09435 [Mycobacterium haemophilum DSM 44634]|uniref:hypothetical protein n=2 Tax=Mycobacterium haemophilum TaxID=29311 RepID=UPI000656716E|nr:hypothetical protein B586_09435 [Mycobacterium haemophilum DSM 44634]
MIARAKVFEQMKLIAAAGISDEGLRKEHGGTGDVGDVGAAQEFVTPPPRRPARTTSEAPPRPPVSQLFSRGTLIRGRVTVGGGGFR